MCVCVYLCVYVCMRVKVGIAGKNKTREKIHPFSAMEDLLKLMGEFHFNCVVMRAISSVSWNGTAAGPAFIIPILL